MFVETVNEAVTVYDHCVFVFNMYEYIYIITCIATTPNMYTHIHEGSVSPDKGASAKCLI